MPLHKIPKHKTATVVSVDRSRGDHWRKLLAFGIVPGASVQVIQKVPAIVVQIGETQVALDTEAASIITARLI